MIYLQFATAKFFIQIVLHLMYKLAICFFYKFRIGLTLITTSFKFFHIVRIVGTMYWYWLTWSNKGRCDYWIKIDVPVMYGINRYSFYLVWRKLLLNTVQLVEWHTCTLIYSLNSEYIVAID